MPHYFFIIKPRKLDTQAKDGAVQGDIPLELIISAAIGIILIHRPIPPNNPCVVFPKKAERDISKSPKLTLSNLSLNLWMQTSTVNPFIYKRVDRDILYIPFYCCAGDILEGY